MCTKLLELKRTEEGKIREKDGGKGQKKDKRN